MTTVVTAAFLAMAVDPPLIIWEPVVAKKPPREIFVHLKENGYIGRWYKRGRKGYQRRDIYRPCPGGITEWRLRDDGGYWPRYPWVYTPANPRWWDQSL
jgi:hypothetical protein